MGYTNGNVTSCYAIGTVQGSGNCGGLIGLVAADGGEAGTPPTVYITNCYALGNVTSNTNVDVGGFVGQSFPQSNLIHYTCCYGAGTASFAGGDPAAGFDGTSSTSSPYLSYNDCYQNTVSSETLGGSSDYDSSLNTALPTGFSSPTWGESSSINNGYPYLQYFGSSTVTP
jgi:hypothetical protein